MQCLKYKHGELEFEPALNRQPVHFPQNRCNVFTLTWYCTTQDKNNNNKTYMAQTWTSHNFALPRVNKR